VAAPLLRLAPETARIARPLSGLQAAAPETGNAAQDVGDGEGKKRSDGTGQGGTVPEG